MKIWFHDRLINVVRSLYSEKLILRIRLLCMLQICVVLSLAPLTNSPRLVNNQKETRQSNVRISRRELADWKNFVEIYNENETKLTKIRFFIFFFPSSKYVKIARLAILRILRILLNKVIKESKRKSLSFLIALSISLYLYLRNFSQEHVFATLGPILKNVSSGKLNWGRNIVKTR